MRDLVCMLTPMLPASTMPVERKDAGRVGRVMPKSMEMLGVNELATSWSLNM